MAEFIFPESRFALAGATSDEIDELRREFNANDLTLQRAQSEYWASQSTGGLTDFLIRLRTANRFGTHVPSDDASPEQSERALRRAESAAEREAVQNDAESVSDVSESNSDESDAEHDDHEG